MSNQTDRKVTELHDKGYTWELAIQLTLDPDPKGVEDEHE